MTHTRERRSTLTLPLSEHLEVAATTILSHIGPRRPTVGLVLGSGLGDYATKLDRATSVDYGDIPQFPVSRVIGHAGRMVIGEKAGLTVACMQGRAHYYEGHDMAKVTFPVRTLVTLGCKTLIITNAAGAVNKKYTSGELVIISDHLNLFPENPLRGPHEDRLGPRFPDMTDAYSPELRELAVAAGKKVNLTLREGIYAGCPGPAYETPAEVRMLRALGADLVGMSTVPEVIVAHQQGARVLGISCVTNLAAGMSGHKLSHDEVTETANKVRNQFIGLLDAILAGLAAEKGGPPAPSEAKEAK